MAQVTTYPLPCRYPLPLAPAPSTRAMSRATEGFSASTATLPDSAATIVLLQFSGSGTDERLVSSVKLRALAMVDHATRRSVPPVFAIMGSRALCRRTAPASACRFAFPRGVHRGNGPASRPDRRGQPAFQPDAHREPA